MKTKLKPRVLVLTDWYYPGFKAGGPIQSIKNLVEHLSQDIDFSVITGDSDLSDSKKYDVHQFDDWIVRDKYRVCYTTQDFRNDFIKKSIEDTSYDFIYLNSLFSVQYTIKPLLWAFRQRCLNKVILAPRGMLGKGALAIKPIKKQIFLFIFRLFGVHKSIVFHTTDASETEDAKVFLGGDIRINEIHNLPASIDPKITFEKTFDTKFIFASRISKKKNLHIAIKAINRLPENVKLNVYGALDDQKYFSECKALVKNASQISFHDAVSHTTLIERLKSHHFFILPTSNENFGHSIIESLSAGVPVIISDQTPWNDIESFGAGWVVDINSPIDAWIRILEQCLSVDETQYQQMSERAGTYVSEKIHITDICNQYKSLFEKN